MALITWTDELAVGVREFDDDHRRLIALINRLWEASEHRQGRDELDGIFTELVEYTRTHFRREEDLFARWGYPGADRHGQKHQGLVSQLADLQARFRDGGTEALADETFEFLRDWLIHHILGDDAIYGTFFRHLGIDSVTASPARTALSTGLPLAVQGGVAGGTIFAAATMLLLYPSSVWANAAYGVILLVLAACTWVVAGRMLPQLRAAIRAVTLLSINRTECELPGRGAAARWGGYVFSAGLGRQHGRPRPQARRERAHLALDRKGNPHHLPRSVRPGWRTKWTARSGTSRNARRAWSPSPTACAARPGGQRAESRLGGGGGKRHRQCHHRRRGGRAAQRHHLRLQAEAERSSKVAASATKRRDAAAPSSPAWPRRRAASARWWA